MQELEETIYWLELLEGTGLCLQDQVQPLKTEADQLMAILVTIVRRTKLGMGREQKIKRTKRKFVSFSASCFQNSSLSFATG
jgi:hypothetical protein